LATHAEIKALLEPVLKRHPDWRFDKRMLFALPVGYYLRGCSLHSSG
jgi:hypothetical protein